MSESKKEIPKIMVKNATKDGGVEIKSGGGAELGIP